MRSRFPHFGSRTVVLATLLGACAAESSVTVDAAPASASDAASDAAPDGVPPTELDSQADAASPPSCVVTGVTSHLDLEYDRIPGVRPELLSLDVYTPDRDAGCAPVPMVIYVHGGGWRQGDKRSRILDKVELFTGAGWVFASVNYRLSPLEIPADPVDWDPDRIQYPIHNRDAAAAVAWLHAHTADFDADPNQLAIMGHSAGAAIVSSIATDPSFLAAYDLGLDTLQCAASLDTEGYDVRSQAEDPTSGPLYRNAFGDDPEVWDQASPMNHIASDVGIPSFFLVVQGRRARVAATQAFADALEVAGVPAIVLYTPEYDHAGVNEAVGNADDTTLTPPLMAFLDACFDP